MPKGTRICKVCGAEYPYCTTERPMGLFRWQDVACSPEHAEIYFDMVLKARSAKPDKAVGTERDAAVEATGNDSASAEEEITATAVTDGADAKQPTAKRSKKRRAAVTEDAE